MCKMLHFLPIGAFSLDFSSVMNQLSYRNLILSPLLCLGFDCMLEQATLESIINPCIIHPTMSSYNGISSKTATPQKLKD